jgi:hypothetical protein
MDLVEDDEDYMFSEAGWSGKELVVWVMLTMFEYEKVEEILLIKIEEVPEVIGAK